MKKTWIVQASAITAAVLVLAGCTSSTTPSSTPSAATQTLRVGFPQDLTSANPALSYGSKDIPTLDLLYDRLIVADPKTGNLLPSAGLASKWGYTDSTNLVFQLTIKSGITFQDGTKLDAAAVVTSLDYGRAAAKVQPLSLAAKQLAPITDIKAVGTSKVDITLSQAYSPFAAVLASPPGMIISPTALAADGTDPTGKALALSGAGTGPYKLASWTPGVGWNLDPYKGYKGTKPSLGKVAFTLIPDAQAELNAFQSHQVDLIFNIAPTAAPSLKGDSKIRVASELTPAVTSMQLAGKGPTADPKVRQAINIAIDRGPVAKAIYPTTPNAAKDLPTNIPAAQDSYPATKKPPLTYSVAKAKQLLSEAGYPNGFTLKTCAAADDPNQKPVDEILNAQLAKVGITTQVGILPSTGPCNVATQAGTYGAFYGTVQGQIDPYLTYNTELTIAAVGASYPTANAQLATVANSFTRSAQIDAYGKLNSTWQVSVPTVLLFSNPLIVGYNSALKGSAVTFTGEWGLRGLSF